MKGDVSSNREGMKVGLENYFKGLYQRTMQEAYGKAIDEICLALRASSGQVLDCGAGGGGMFDTLNQHMSLEKDRYTGVEWNPPLVESARAKELNVVRGDLNRALDFADESLSSDGIRGTQVSSNPSAVQRTSRRVLS